MMLASPVFSEIRFFIAYRFLRDFSCHFTQNERLKLEYSDGQYRKKNQSAQVI